MNDTTSLPKTPDRETPDKPENLKPQTLREAMFHALRCCEIWGVVVIVKQGDTTITLESEAFVDVLHPREPADGFEQEVILITSEELQDAYHKTFKKISDPTEEQTEQWLQTVVLTLQGRIRAAFK